MQGPRTSGPRRPPTIRDVARHAGVSVATVSRVLNEIPVVRSEVRERTTGISLSTRDTVATLTPAWRATSA